MLYEVITVYQAGTLSGNPLAMAAGIATLKLLQAQDFYKDLNDKSAWFAAQLQEVAEASGVSVQLNRVGSLLTPFFAIEPVIDFTSAMKSDTDRYARHWRAMLEMGVVITSYSIHYTKLYDCL